MMNARIIFNSSDEPEVVLYNHYHEPIAILTAEEIKRWAELIDGRIREIKKLRKKK